MICFDTNTVMAVLNGPGSPVRMRIDAAIGSGANLAISSIVLFELCYRAANSARPDRNARRIADFLAGPIEVLAFESEDAREAGDICAALECSRTPVGAYEVLVAAQARRRAALLVTANGRAFVGVPRLRIEDWTRPQ
jgi:tRNA(fMet)-specific endonuclease VapC